VAREIKKAGAFLVPTVVTHEAIWREGKAHGITEHQLSKINMARKRSVEGLAHADRGNPLADLRIFQDQAKLRLIMKGGVVDKQTL
jgi:hypothetical protein